MSVKAFSLCQASQFRHLVYRLFHNYKNAVTVILNEVKDIKFPVQDGPNIKNKLQNQDF